MRAQKLTLSNFRNFDNLELSFEPGLTVIAGVNGAGKTNILEALYMCSIGRSPRTRQDSLLIKKGKCTANIKLEYLRTGVSRDVGVNLSATKGKSVIVDGMPSAKVSDIVGNFSCVYFSPDEIDIVRGGPQYRRRFLDIINCQISPSYMLNLKNFQHALKQRNALLRTMKITGEYDSALLPWDTQIMSYSLKIMLRRYNFLKSLQRIVNAIMRILTDNTETLRLTYRTFCDRLEQVHLNDLEEVYTQKVRQNFIKDVLTHTSSVGPHLDDIEIKLCYIKNPTPKQGKDTETYEYINLRNEGSLGQQRTATLALKIAEIFVYHQFYGEKPMLFLDDVLSELDFARRQKLMNYCKHFDTVVTCTEWSYENPAPDTLFEVRDGQVFKKEVRKEDFSFEAQLNERALEFAKKINEMPEGYFDSPMWLRPHAVSDEPICKAQKLEEISPEEREKILSQPLPEEEQLDEYDIWEDGGKPLKKPTRKNK